MSNYLERLERELLAAGGRYRAPAGRQSRARRRPLAGLGKTAPIALSFAVTIAIVAVVVATGVLHGTSGAGTHGHSTVTPPSGGYVAPIVSRSPACRLRRTQSGLPPLVSSNASPGTALASILAIARTPVNGTGVKSLGPFDRDPVGILTVYDRYIRIVHGARGTRVAFFPASICNEVQTSRAGQSPQRIRIAPEQAMVMLVLSNPLPRPAILVGTASTISSGPAVPGLDLPNQRGWIQATVVPDGVARVVMHFTPPFLHHYTATVMIHDNVGIAVRKPDYTPTTVSWHGANGQLIKTFVDRSALRYDNCLAAHKKRCN
jgi:hypothetical protein